MSNNQKKQPPQGGCFFSFPPHYGEGERVSYLITTLSCARACSRSDKPEQALSCLLLNHNLLAVDDIDTLEGLLHTLTGEVVDGNGSHYGLNVLDGGRLILSGLSRAEVIQRPVVPYEPVFCEATVNLAQTDGYCILTFGNLEL